MSKTSPINKKDVYYIILFVARKENGLLSLFDCYKNPSKKKRNIWSDIQSDELIDEWRHEDERYFIL